MLKNQSRLPAAALNCWEYMDCEREPGGVRAAEAGICPAATETELDGYNSGRNGGRFCWAVAGTFCGDKVQGSFADKQDSCFNCHFFKKVQKEEGPEGFTLIKPRLIF